MDLRKQRDKASEAFTRGKFAKAGELYAEYCEKDPRDLQARLRMGDAWSKAGDRPKAIAAYKSAAEGFAREGFLPRAIAASKLILELDPAHVGVQQMLANLYARKSTGPGTGRSTPAPEATAPIEPVRARHAPIELPDEEPAAIDLELPSVPEAAAATEVGSPALELEPGSSSELPPELETFESYELTSEDPGSDDLAAAAPSEPATAPEFGARATPEHPTAPASEPASAPPGLRRRATAAELAATELSATALQNAPAASLQQPAPSPAESLVAATEAPTSTVEIAATSRIFIPGRSSSEGAPVVTAPPAPQSASIDQNDLARAFSRFDELSLDDAPATLASEPELPSFTELELDADSLLHAVEVAAQAGRSQRGETIEEEEEVFSITAELSADSPKPDELPKIPLFSDLPPDAFIELFDRCPLRRFGAGERIIAQGSVGDAFYVVCEGQVRVVRDEGDSTRELATLADGAFFGEMALLSGAPRSASVESAAEDTQVLEISAPVLAQLSHRFPSVASALKKFCRQRMLINVMNTSALFRPFSKGDRRTLVEKFRARDVSKGDLVIREGAQTDGLYIVLSGEMEVVREGQVLARLHEGELFGEMSLLKKTDATASVRATRRTSLIRLPRADFDALILSHPQILVLVSELTDDRQRQNDAVIGGAAEIGEEGLMLV